MPISPKDDVSSALLSALLEDPRYRGVVANLLSNREDVGVRSGWLPQGTGGVYSPYPFGQQIRVDPSQGDPLNDLAHELMHYGTENSRDAPGISDLDAKRLHELVYQFGDFGTASRGEKKTYGPLEEIVPDREWRAKVLRTEEIPPPALFMEMIRAVLNHAVQQRHETTLEALK